METASTNLMRHISKAMDALPEVHICTSEPGRGSGEPDYLVRLDVKGQPATLLIECKTSGYPRDAREAAWRLDTYVQTLSAPSPVRMFVAPALSEGARTLLQERGISYGDGGGSLYLRLPWALYFVERNTPQAPPRKAKALYRGTRAQALLMLLSHPKRAWHIHELAAEAHVAASTAHEVFRALEDEEWVEREGKGREVVRQLREPGKLLDAWAEAHTLKLYEPYSFYAWAQSPAKLREKVGNYLEEKHVPYALTLASGAEIVAPFAVGNETQSILLPYGTALAPLTQAMGLKPAEDGANVTFLLSKDKVPFLLRQQKERVWVASDIQLYLDLFASAGRGREQARHLRQERLGY